MEVWRQSLLSSLENDLGISTLVQLAATLRLNGDIEPGGDPLHPPQLFGSVVARGGAHEDRLPYTLSPTKLALRDGPTWFNFLVAAQDAAAQRAFSLDLDYQIGFVERQIDGSEERCGYIPSNWISYVLQADPAGLSANGNTLTAPVGATRIPVPLRSFPPTPMLVRASAVQDHPPAEISTIAEALTWTYEQVVERPAAAQDSLFLTLTLNQPASAQASVSDSEQSATGRPLPTDLFDALARFAFEYPQLEPLLGQFASDPSTRAIQALRDFLDIVSGVALTWADWTGPESAIAALATQASVDSDQELWQFRIDSGEDDDRLIVRATTTRRDELPPLPSIAGYSEPVVTGDTAVYTPVGARPLELRLSWSGLFVLDYQSVRASAFIERNSNLAPAGQETNPRFVYRTETVNAPTPTVPLIRAERPVTLASQDRLMTAVRAMLTELATAPPDAVVAGLDADLRIESSVNYSFQLLAHLGSTLDSILPLFLVQENVPESERESVAAAITETLSLWRDRTDARVENSAISFGLTLFATRIVAGLEQLPLVQLPALQIPVPDDPDWWMSVLSSRSR